MTLTRQTSVVPRVKPLCTPLNQSDDIKKCNNNSPMLTDTTAFSAAKQTLNHPNREKKKS